MLSSSVRALAIRGALFLPVALFGATHVAAQGEIDVPFEFRAGDPARADEVNQNFRALVDVMKELRDDLDALQPRVDELELENAGLTADVEALLLENSALSAQLAQVQDQLGPLDLEVDELQAQALVLVEDLAVVQERTQFISISEDTLDGLAGPHMIVEQANLHVRSGSGATDDNGAALGLGNLVLGYNELESATERAGSHNLVVGSGHEYSSVGGIVAGLDNRISGVGATVLGGRENQATGAVAAVLGGAFNQATGEESAVSGGVSNFAAAQRASISGGAQNTASGVSSSISGGSGGATGGFAASISGGQSGIASGDQSSVTGGQSNSVFGDKSSVSGGFNQTENNDFSWRACNLTCD